MFDYPVLIGMGEWAMEGLQLYLFSASTLLLHHVSFVLRKGLLIKADAYGVEKLLTDCCSLYSSFSL